STACACASAWPEEERPDMSKQAYLTLTLLFWLVALGLVILDTASTAGVRVEPAPFAYGSGQAASGGHCSGRARSRPGGGRAYTDPPADTRRAPPACAWNPRRSPTAAARPPPAGTVRGGSDRALAAVGNTPTALPIRAASRRVVNAKALATERRFGALHHGDRKMRRPPCGSVA